MTAEDRRQARAGRAIGLGEAPDLRLPEVVYSGGGAWGGRGGWLVRGVYGWGVVPSLSRQETGSAVTGGSERDDCSLRSFLAGQDTRTRLAVLSVAVARSLAAATDAQGTRTPSLRHSEAS